MQDFKYKKIWKYSFFIILSLMVIRTIIFVWWLLDQRPSSYLAVDYINSKAESKQYDITLMLTAIGWLIMGCIFVVGQIKNLRKSGDMKSVPYSNAFYWLFVTKDRKDKSNNKKMD